MKLPLPLQQTDRTRVMSGRTRLSYFAGCDYFRLASHPEVLKAAADGLCQYGLNVSASRMTTGNHALYGKLETALEGFFQAETATLASNGYSPSLIVAQALKGKFSHVLVDDHAHGCLLDAAGMLDCPIIRFKHCDPADLRNVLMRLGSIKPLLLTDGMFSHDGSVAPLRDYLAVLPKSAKILVDDAHAAGILGATGRGSLEFHRLTRRQIIQTITLSKAFGVYGGAVFGDLSLRRDILNTSRIFSGNTPIPLPLANAALKSVSLLRQGNGLLNSLRKNILLLRKELGLPTASEAALQCPIFALFPASKQALDLLKRRLRAANIHAPFIRYPGGPKEGYFRFAISSEHDQEQLKSLVNAVRGSFP